MTELGVKGGLRAAISPVSHLETKGLSDAVNTNQTQLLLKFRLLRGSYATTFLRELMKPKDLIKSGF
jgi:tRNA(Glu) U13 pseudouridine synthase TruD